MDSLQGRKGWKIRMAFVDSGGSGEENKIPVLDAPNNGTFFSLSLSLSLSLSYHLEFKSHAFTTFRCEMTLEQQIHRLERSPMNFSSWIHESLELNTVLMQQKIFFQEDFLSLADPKAKGCSWCHTRSVATKMLEIRKPHKTRRECEKSACAGNYPHIMG